MRDRPCSAELEEARLPPPRVPALAGALCAAAGLLAAACVEPRPLATRAVRPEPARALPPAPATVLVRLAEHERAERLELVGERGRIVCVRRGPRVVASDGRAGDALWVRPAAGAAGVVLAGRTYPGAVEIARHRAGGLKVLARVPLEDYVAGVVAAELSLWSAEPAELEAQAIAARSYALAAVAERSGLRGGAFLWDDTRDQAFRGAFVPQGDAGSARAAARLSAAVARTRGLVLVRAGRILDARYHAACGGATSRFADIFPAEADPLVAIPPAGTATCEPCARIAAREAGRPEPPRWRGQVRWCTTLPEHRLRSLAGALGIGARVLSFAPTRVDAAGRWLEVRLVGDGGVASVTLAELRRRLEGSGWLGARVTRTWPRPGEPLTGGLSIEGVGRGHGVGLCQVGARGYAREGLDAAAILAHYYPGAHLERLAEEGR